MKQNIVVPQVGESVSKGIIAQWIRSSGDTITEGDDLFEFETDKATMLIPAPFSGQLTTLVEAKIEVSVGQIVGTIEVQAFAPSEKTEQPVAPASQLAPSVRRIVAEHGLNEKTISGSGKAGRITKADALEAVASKGGAEAGVPVNAVPGVQQQGSSYAAPQPTAHGQTRVPMTHIRKRTALRLQAARLEAVHVTTFNEIDMSKLMALRSRFGERFEKSHGVKLGLMSFFVKACCAALRKYPDVNAFVEGDQIVYNPTAHIGVAVSLEQGLVVPVIRSADALSLAQIESAISSFAQRARQKRLLPDELQGGTFSITNGGIFGSMLSTPVPAFPQTAILGMHTITKRAVVVDDTIRIAPVMYTALTYDHRIIDGREAIGFLVAIKQRIEEPETFLLEL
jgi:2-oxoglutarate dehydrogenase E2 component (dihydrolipoamide succinyltransferase)